MDVFPTFFDLNRKKTEKDLENIKKLHTFAPVKQRDMAA